MAGQNSNEYSSPLKKLVQFFHNSRDRWKAKHHAAKKAVKTLQNQTRAVERSRETWRTRAESAERRMKELEREIGELKSRRAAGGIGG